VREVGPLVVASLAVMGSPGPATISLVAAGSAYGVRRSVGYLAGIVVGTTLVLLAVAAGITVALLAMPALRVALVAVSAAYILWLAWRVATSPPLSQHAAPAPSAAGGALLGVANPKAWIAIAAVFGSVRVAAAPKTAILIAMIVLINVMWLVAGASLAPLLRDPRRARAVNTTLAATLIAAIALAVVH
jgi:threonine/homoserine/homoserine lactone efflux protein